MSKLVDINGNPYTKADEDIELMNLHKQFCEAAEKEWNEAVAHMQARGGQLQLNPKKLLVFVVHAYVLGRCSTGERYNPTELDPHLEARLATAFERIQRMYSEACFSASQGRTFMEPRPVLDCIDQAYYLGIDQAAGS